MVKDPILVKDILLVEDDPNINRLLSFALSTSGEFKVKATQSGIEALELMHAAPPDLVVLDILLPDISGLEVIRKMRTDPRLADVAVIFLTALGEEHDRIAGFEAGADDYLSKPFLPSELLLRIKAIIRRTRCESKGVGPSEKTIGELTLLENDHRVLFRGQEIHLTYTEYRMMSFLMKFENQVKSREALLKEVWGETPDDAGRVVDSHVKRLRSKLGDAGEYIHTIYGMGYRFEVPSLSSAKKH